MDENRVLKASNTKLKENFEKQQRQIEHLKSNIEGVRGLQDHHDRASRDGVGRAVIQEMKQSMAAGQRDSQFHAQQSKELERLKRIELNERTKEASGPAHDGAFL